MKIRISLENVTQLDEQKFRQGYVEVDFGEWFPLSRLINDQNFLEKFLEAQASAILSSAIRCFVLAHQADEECVAMGMSGFSLERGAASGFLSGMEALEKKVMNSVVMLMG